MTLSVNIRHRLKSLGGIVGVPLSPTTYESGSIHFQCDTIFKGC